MLLLFSEWCFDLLWLVKWVSSRALLRNILLKYTHHFFFFLFNKWCKMKTSVLRLTSNYSKHFTSYVFTLPVVKHPDGVLVLQCVVGKWTHDPVKCTMNQGEILNCWLLNKAKLLIFLRFLYLTIFLLMFCSVVLCVRFCVFFS